MFTFADMSQMYIEVCKWRPVPTADARNERICARPRHKGRRGFQTPSHKAAPQIRIDVGIGIL